MEFLATDLQHKIALRHNQDEISFLELQREVNVAAAKLRSTSSKLLELQAENTIQFIIQLLAALSNQQPVAVVSKMGIVNHQTSYDPNAALILFTSASTGKAKAVQLSQQNIMANCNAVIKSLNFTAARDQFLFLPLSYSFGLLGQLLPGLMAGLTTHLTENFIDIKTILEADSVPQMWSGVPSHWHAILRIAQLYPLAAQQLTHVISAGASLTIELRTQLIKTFPNAVIYNNYGLTEASPRVLSLSSNSPLFVSNHVGYPVGDWELKLSREQELYIRGSQVMLGYGAGEQSPVKNGWLHTGDIAEITEEGLVSILGRLDHSVKVGGEKVNLDELEQAVNRIPGVGKVALVAIPDSVYEMRLLFFFEKTTMPHPLSIEQIYEKLEESIVLPKSATFIQILETLPLNQNGKLDRASLRKMTEPIR